MKPTPCHWSEVFPGAVPGWIIFGGQVEDIRHLFENNLFSEEESYRYHSLAEVSYIGLIAYFEGFVKYHFATIINICPHLLNDFSSKRSEVSIPIADLASLDNVHKHIGFVVAEQFSFGNPKEINGLFRDLISMTPFSSSEKRRYDKILHDRHQIVHSAGLYTSKYLRTRGDQIPKDQSEPYIYGVTIEPSRLLDDASFLLSIAEKIVQSAHSVLENPDTWERPEEMEMMSQQIGWMEWNEFAFCEPEITPSN